MLESTINYVKELPDDEFQYLFARVIGWVRSKAERDPDATCRMGEVAELFEALFDRMQGGDDENPSCGNSRGIKVTCKCVLQGDYITRLEVLARWQKRSR